MSQDQPEANSRGVPSVLHAQRFVLGAAALLLIVFTAMGALALKHAAVAALVIAAAAFFTVWLAQRAQWNVETPVKTEAEAIDDSASVLIQAASFAMVIIDRDGYVRGFNAKASEIAPALRRNEPVTFALRIPAIVDAIRRASTSGEVQRAEFSERVPIDRWYEAHVAPTDLTAPNGRALMLITFQDLTPLRRVEEMRVDFVANASHELRTPLAALSGFIDTLQGPARNDAAAREKFLAIMKAQADRMARVIDDLLSLSRIELDAHIRPNDDVNVAGAVRQVVDGLQGLARERGVEVAISGPESLNAIGDRDELLRVFENLIENALKYAGSGKRVDVTLSEPESGEAKIAVRDYGPGIAPEHLPRLTERFYRVDVSHSRAEGGTGLGLALVKHILNRHRGRLSIDSIVGTGSNFTVYLPVSTSAVPPASDMTAKSAA